MATTSAENANDETKTPSDHNPFHDNSPTNESNDIEIKYDKKQSDNTLQSIELVAGVNNNTQQAETQPSPPLSQQCSPSAESDPLPYGWRIGHSTDGKTYYINDITHTTQWTKPTQIIITSPAEQLEKMNGATELISQQSQPSISATFSDKQPQPTQIIVTSVPGHRQLEKMNSATELISSPGLSIEKPTNDMGDNDDSSKILTPTSIKLNKYDFAKLVPDKISCCEHFVIFLTTISLWLVLTTSIAYIITGNVGLFAFIVPVVMIANIVMVCCNPIYFISFRYKYHPKTLDDIMISDAEDIDIINPSLAVNKTKTKTVMGNVAQSDNKYVPARPTKWRICQRAGNRLFGFFIIAVLCIPSISIDNNQHGWRKFFSVLFCVLIVLFDIKLISHFIVYYKRKYWIYNGVIWILLSLIQLLIMIGYLPKFGSTALFIGFALGMLLFECALGKYGSNIYKRSILYNLSPSRFAKPFEWNISFNTTIKEVETNTNPDDPRKKFNSRIVGCCCNRVICGFKTCLRIQVAASAAGFWGFWGIVYIAPAKFLVFPVCLFLYCVLVWNPWYYYKAFDKLNEEKCCCTCKKWCYYICATPSVIVGGILNTIFIFQCISGIVTKADHLVQGYMGVYVVAFMVGTMFFYLPSTGYCFHTVPVHFVMSHLLTAVVLFLAPVGILINSINVDFLAAWVDYDPVLAVLISSVIVVTFLSIAGAFCSCYRFQKSLVESQAYLTTISGFSKGIHTIEKPLTIIRMSTFILTFVDFLTDSVWTFSPNTFRTDFTIFKTVAILLWILQLIVQLISVLSAVSTLRSRLDENKIVRTHMGELRNKLCSNACICILGCWFYPIIWVFYVIFMIALSLLLGVTKLLAIRQVREWWLSWIISGYYDKNKHSVRDLTPTVDNNNNKKKEDNVVMDEMMKNDDAKGIWKLYYWIENQTPKSWVKFKINASVYNNYLISELIVESIPLLVLNLVNATNNRWTFISYLSALSSAVFILYGLLKVAYYVGCKNYDLAKFVL